MDMINIDTDVIVPKNFLKTIKRTGLGKHLFHEMRYTEDGARSRISCSTKAPIGRSSAIIGGDIPLWISREHAPGVKDFGIRAVISTSFADIFYNNCFKNGILPIRMPKRS